jgi:hypothetical protein
VVRRSIIPQSNAVRIIAHAHSKLPSRLVNKNNFGSCGL